MGAYAFGLWQLMAHHMARQCRIERLTPALGAFVSCAIFAVAITAKLFLYGRLGVYTQNLGFVKEHVLLALAADLAFGRKDLAHEFVKPFFEQIALSAHQNEFAIE